MDTILQKGDKIIAIAEDDDRTNLPFQPGKANIEDITLQPPALPTPECTLILGWNWKGSILVRELDEFVAPGSTLMVVANDDEAEDARTVCQAVLVNQNFNFTSGDTTDRDMLDSLDVTRFKHIIILADIGLNRQQADARTLISLLHLRDIADSAGKEIAIVTEMLDVRNRVLAEAARADDFIVGDRILSLMLTQISENKALNRVFAEMFTSAGAEIYLRLASNYVPIGKPVNFYTIAAAAREKNETAIGYRLKKYSHEADRSYGVIINPK
jgi:voltage-gated potassium channel Kch